MYGRATSGHINTYNSSGHWLGGVLAGVSKRASQFHQEQTAWQIETMLNN